MIKSDRPAETLSAPPETYYADGPQHHEQHDELQWLAVAASRIINRAIAGDATGEQLGQLFETYRSTGESEQLIGVASGVVALVGLHHVKKGTLAAREILEAAPQLIIDVAEDDNVDVETFAAQLADATEEFCVGTMEETGITDDVLGSIQSRVPTNSRFDLNSLNHLAGRAKQGDIKATNQLMAESANWARMIIATRGYYMPGGEQDDLCQDALMSVMRAFNVYDPARGNFAPLAEIAIKRGIWTSIRTAARNKHSPLNHAKDLYGNPQAGDGENDPILLDVLPSPSPNDNTEIKVLDRERLRALPSLLDKLTDLEHKAIFLQADGLSYDEIARTLQVNNSSVDNALQRAKKKFAAWEAGEIAWEPESRPVPRVPKQKTALQEAKEKRANEGDLFSPEESLVLAEMAHCGNLELMSEKLETSISTLSRIIKPVRERFGLESNLQLMLAAIALGAADISHIPEGVTSALNEKDRELLSAYYGPDPAVRADAVKNRNMTESRFIRMYDKLGLDITGSDARRWQTVLYAVKDGIIELPDPAKLKTNST